jgi:hypothetical protein
MFNLYKKTSTAFAKYSKNLSKFTLAFSLIFFSSCSLWQAAPESDPVKALPSQRELLFEQAEKYYEAGRFDEALPLYFKIARDPAPETDSIYDKSLLSLAELYEKNDQPEKSILALNELLKRDNNLMPRTQIKFMLMKNHFRITNYYQARKIKTGIDEDYKISAISLNELYQALYYGTTLYFDRRLFDELSFLGEIQKYFVYVMESGLAPENEKLTDLIILYYSRFIGQLDKDILSNEIKRKLTISLLDQLGKFDKYLLIGQQDNLAQLQRFAKYSESQQKILTERLTSGRF